MSPERASADDYRLAGARAAGQVVAHLNSAAHVSLARYAGRGTEFTLPPNPRVFCNDW